MKSLRMGSSMPSELDFWDEELVREGSRIMAQRIETVDRLSEVASPIHWRETTFAAKLEQPSFR